MLARAEARVDDDSKATVRCLGRARLRRWLPEEGGAQAVVDPIARVEAPSNQLPIVLRVRELARQYARALDLSPATVEALATQPDPGRLSDEVALVCDGDVCRHLVAIEDPVRRLTILAAALQQMLEEVAAEPKEPSQAGSASAWLTVVAEHEDRLVGRKFALQSGINTVGRALACEVCLSLESVSRRHCTVAWTDGGGELVDRDSMNGSFVNGADERSQCAVLRDGDCVRVGSVTLKLTTTDAQAHGSRGSGLQQLEGHRAE